MIKIFIKENCNYCGDCLARCQYLGYDTEKAIAEFKKLVDDQETPVLSDCVTCYACNEYCPKDANPFDLIVQRQEEHNSVNIPEGMKQMIADQLKPPGLKGPIDTEGKMVMSICVFADHPKFYEGQLFKDLKLISGRNFFCNLLYLHTGQESVIKQRAQTIIDNLASLNVPEIIFFHDECYAFTTKYAPGLGINVPFNSIHLYEYLYGYLKHNKDKIKKLGLKIALQRSCSNRFNPEVDHFVDDICELIGVERVAREYDRENALCCTAPQGQLGKGDMAKENIKRNMDDAVKHGAQAMVTMCPMCYDTLKRPIRKAGMKKLFIHELVRLALGELDFETLK